MLSIANVSAGQASSYYEKDDYYVRDEGGIWQGKLKEDLSLSDNDNISKEEFDRLVNLNEERAGFDLCFSAPKSVSMAFCLEEHRENITEAHNKAVEETLKLIEENEIFARITKDKVTQRILTGNMLCGKFNHYVSRDQDPQIHTHCVVLNHTFYNGKRYAISNESLYENKLLYGQIYRSYLANHLQEKGFKIEVTNRQEGFFELSGVKREDIEFFSKRRMEVLEKLNKWGEFSSKAAEAAALKTRQAKENKNLKELIESWKINLKEMNFSIKKGQPFEQSDQAYQESFNRTKDYISKQTFAFTDKEFSKEALRMSLGTGTTITDVEKYLKEEVKEQNIYFLGKMEGRNYYCTKESYELEQSIFNHIETGKNKVNGLELNKIDKYVENTTLTDEQKEAVRHICNSSDRFSAVVGLAGTGKTYMLNHARELLEQEGYMVKGMSLAGQAAHNLQEEAKIESKTIHSFLNQLEKEAGKFDPNQDLENKDRWQVSGVSADNREVWIIDEAGMVNNNLMNELLIAAEARDAKVILVGDNKQLQAIGAGSSFDNLIRKNRISYVTMEDIQRQKNEKLKEAVNEVVKGDVSRSLKILSNKTIEIENREERLESIARDYTFQKSNDRRNSIILTGSNYDRHELNKLVRKNLQNHGELKKGKMFITQSQNGITAEREFSEQDKIMFLKNDKTLGVKNGQVGYITAIKGNTLWIETDKKILRLDTDQYNYIDHGYALTVHKAQGQTVNKAFVHINTTQKKLNSRNSYYVDISRAKYDVKIYTNDKERLHKAVSKFDVKLSSDDFPFKPENKRKIEWESFKEKNSITDWLFFKNIYAQTKEVKRDKSMEM